MNLILCITPLQVLIAEKIINQNQNDFIGLYLPYGVNSKSEPKHRHYFAKLQNVCTKSAFIELKNQTWGERFATLKHIKTVLKDLQIWQKPINNVYLASIDVLFLQYITSKIKFQNLFTFDDGTANIFPNSTYYQPLSKSLPQKLFKKTVGITYPDISSILAISQQHYTIFGDEKNLIDNLQSIDLFDKFDQANTAIIGTQKILIGQGLDNFIGATAYRDLVKNMVNVLGIDQFVPHPRENVDFSDLLTVIHSDKIIEDYLLEQIQTNPNTQFEIYTFFSTAVFSLKNFPRTQIFLIYNEALMAQFSEAYDFLASRGFTLIDIDNKVKTNP